ncbi:MAG: hypothetical protein EPN38_08180 [Rhodanobacteraceae bacterium]|nr:MAG: hypothetical protein EPN38_08180 [Rhodanobacteraceae bacterium]
MDLVSKLARLGASVVDRFQLQATIRREYDRVKREVELKTPGNPAIHGYKVYSQSDEDGILAYIFSKISTDHVFVEIGCGNGLENNTHALILSGWRGIWIDGNERNIRAIRAAVPRNNRLVYECKMITVDNIVSTLKSSLGELGTDSTDLLSVDIDSNDIYVLSEAIKHIKPKVLCVEYNAKFPPPMDVKVRLPSARWTGDDYQGASLQSFVNTIEPFGYHLITCNLSGVNAFFVRSELADKFPRYTTTELYQPARFYLRHLASGHPASLKFLANAVAEGTQGHI